MPQCSLCKRRGLFLRLSNGLCSSCTNSYSYYAREFENEMRILTESLRIIKHTKNLDTLLSRKDLCLRSLDRMEELNNYFKFLPSYSMTRREDVIRACDIREEELIEQERLERLSLEISESINEIGSIYVSLYPWNQGIDVNFKEHPENVDRAIECYRRQIRYFYEQKHCFISKGPLFAEKWEKYFDHCHNSRNSDFCLVKTAEDALEKLERNRLFYLYPEDSVLDMLKDNSGILQKSFPELFDPDLKDYVLYVVRKLAADGRIIRTKSGRNYALCLPEDFD